MRTRPTRDCDQRRAAVYVGLFAWASCAQGCAFVSGLNRLDEVACVDACVDAAAPADAFVDSGADASGGREAGFLDAPFDAPSESSIADSGAGDAAISVYRAAVLADAPLAYWRFGEASGTVAVDETGHGNGALFGGGITFGAGGAIVGDTNTAIHLDGTDGLNAGLTFDFAGSAPFTLEAWVRLDAVDDNYRHLFIKDDDPATGREEYGIFVQATELLGFERYVGGTSAKTHAPLPVLNQWTYVVGTYDGAIMTLSIDGVVVQTEADTRAQLSKNVPEYVGCKGIGQGVIEGSLDEFAIYDHALTAARIRAHWAASGR